MTNLSKYIDHTLLKPICTSEDIKRICREAVEYGFKSVCIPPSHAVEAKKFLADTDVLLCTVIGFPLGYNDTATKLCEISSMLKAGVDEFDVVVNVSKIKSGAWTDVEAEIKLIVTLLKPQNKVFKLIFETAYLDTTEILKLCDICVTHGVDFLKTSTGFAPKGADLDVVKMMRSHVGDAAKIKASGGIVDYETAMNFIEAGADRLGTSSGIRIVTEAPSTNNQI
ncbi:MAG: deoxyribose-phosphate aldolase [Saprospiraceae bacterium]|nr:deoxyribose-phosphate aldolase [Saprospiraceae bacterium]